MQGDNGAIKEATRCPHANSHKFGREEKAMTFLCGSICTEEACSGNNATEPHRMDAHTHILEVQCVDGDEKKIRDCRIY